MPQSSHATRQDFNLCNIVLEGTVYEKQASRAITTISRYITESGQLRAPVGDPQESAPDLREIFVGATASLTQNTITESTPGPMGSREQERSASRRIVLKLADASIRFENLESSVNSNERGYGHDGDAYASEILAAITINGKVFTSVRITLNDVRTSGLLVSRNYHWSVLISSDQGSVRSVVSIDDTEERVITENLLGKRERQETIKKTRENGSSAAGQSPRTIFEESDNEPQLPTDIHDVNHEEGTLHISQPRDGSSLDAIFSSLRIALDQKIRSHSVPTPMGSRERQISAEHAFTLTHEFEVVQISVKESSHDENGDHFVAHAERLTLAGHVLNNVTITLRDVRNRSLMYGTSEAWRVTIQSNEGTFQFVGNPTEGYRVLETSNANESRRQHESVIPAL